MMGRPSAKMLPYRHSDPGRMQSGYYVRLSVVDRPGVLASIAARMADQGISLESIVQRSRAPRADAPDPTHRNHPQPITLITYETSEEAMKAALALIRDDGHVVEPPQFIRIEQL
jgi:homoserine dehydrogenase